MDTPARCGGSGVDMKFLNYVLASLAIVAVGIPVLVVGCTPTNPAVNPPVAVVTTHPTTQPTTQPAKAAPTIPPVIVNLTNAALEYGPIVQAILAMIPQTVPAAAFVGIGLYVLAEVKKLVEAKGKTNAVDVAGFAVNVEKMLAPHLPDKAKNIANEIAVALDAYVNHPVEPTTDPKKL